MRWVHVGLDLKDKAGHFFPIRLDLGFNPFVQGFLIAWRRGIISQTVKQFAHAKLTQSRAKEDRCHMAFAIGFKVKCWIATLDQLR